MVRKPNSMYRNLAKKAYTRKEYMGGIPGVKVVHFDMGNLTSEFPMEVSLVVDESCQIRHSALMEPATSIPSGFFGEHRFDTCVNVFT